MGSALSDPAPLHWMRQEPWLESAISFPFASCIVLEAFSLPAWGFGHWAKHPMSHYPESWLEMGWRKRNYLLVLHGPTEKWRSSPVNDRTGPEQLCSSRQRQRQTVRRNTAVWLWVHGEPKMERDAQKQCTVVLLTVALPGTEDFHLPAEHHYWDSINRPCSPNFFHIHLAYAAISLLMFFN